MGGFLPWLVLRFCQHWVKSAISLSGYLLTWNHSAALCDIFGRFKLNNFSITTKCCYLAIHFSSEITHKYIEQHCFFWDPTCCLFLFFFFFICFWFISYVLTSCEFTKESEFFFKVVWRSPCKILQWEFRWTIDRTVLVHLYVFVVGFLNCVTVCLKLVLGFKFTRLNKVILYSLQLVVR